MAKIREYRQAYKQNGKFEYPKYFDIYQKTLASIWRPQEADFEADIRDWQHGTEDERAIIGGILRGFTQLECYVSDYWASIPETFPKHEIAAMARVFSLSEVVHAEAYNLLSDTLGLDEFEAFLGDPVAQEKLNYFLRERSPKVALAIFSGAGEGVSLFSSFAALLSLNRTGKYKGISQIISWSALDEQTHSDGGISLFRDLVAEEPLTETEINEIHEGFQQVIQNEYAFIDKIFENRSLLSISAFDLKQYILFRANDRLRALGIDRSFMYDSPAANNVKDWFHPLVFGKTSTDFFAQSKDGSNYIAKPTQNFSSVNLKELELTIQ
jgi:ribonucleoside-diphosphate reductase beta chain